MAREWHVESAEGSCPQRKFRCRPCLEIPRSSPGRPNIEPRTGVKPTRKIVLSSFKLEPLLQLSKEEGLKGLPKIKAFTIKSLDHNVTTTTSVLRKHLAKVR